MDQVREIIESQYTGTCDVYEYRSVKDPITKITKTEPVKVLTSKPCRLSFKNISKANQSDVNSSIVQEIKLFISPDVTIKPGSKIVITQNFRTNEYMNSGEPGLYSTHQEIILEKYKEKA